MKNKLTEFEENTLQLVEKYKEIKCYYQIDFVSDLRKIMPPTCTPNERKFLDEVKEKGEYEQNGSFYFYGKINMGHDGYINQAGFNANLPELLEKLK